MTHQKFTELLSKQLSGEISPEEYQEFNELMKENAAYRDEYNSLSAYFAEEPAPYAHADDLFDRIKAQILEQPEEATQKSKSFGLWPRIAAALAFAMIAFALYQYTFNKPGQRPDTSWKALRTPSRLKSNLVLADGTKVMLNAETQLRYPEGFKGNTREVYLNGEAYFDVATDQEHPFIIHTDKIDIKVLGTAFDVKAYQQDAAVETTLIRGAVAISMKGLNQTVTLKPNEKFSMENLPGTNTTNPKYQVSKLNLYNPADSSAVVETSWTANKLVFKNQPFHELANNLSRWYGVKIVFKKESLKNAQFTGQFEKENINDVFRALQLIEAFNYSMQGKTVYIY